MNIKVFDCEYYGYDSEKYAASLLRDKVLDTHFIICLSSKEYRKLGVMRIDMITPYQYIDPKDHRMFFKHTLGMNEYDHIGLYLTIPINKTALQARIYFTLDALNKFPEYIQMVILNNLDRLV